MKRNIIDKSGLKGKRVLFFVDELYSNYDKKPLKEIEQLLLQGQNYIQNAGAYCRPTLHFYPMETLPQNWERHASLHNLINVISCNDIIIFGFDWSNSYIMAVIYNVALYLGKKIYSFDGEVIEKI